MPQDGREAQIRKFLDEVFTRHDLTRLDQYLDADLVSHWLGDRTLHGLQAWKAGMTSFFAAFPDAAYTLDDIFFAGDKGVARHLARDAERRMGRHRAHGAEGDLDRHHHRPFRGQQTCRGLGRIRQVQSVPPAWCCVSAM